MGRFNVLDLQMQIRRLPKPVVAMVAGYAIGGGHVLHLVCDLTIAATNARFGQTGPKVGSFDGGYGSGLLARTVGQKKAREIWFSVPPVRRPRSPGDGAREHRGPGRGARRGDRRVVPPDAAAQSSGPALLKASLNAADDGLAGIQQLAGDATLLYYMSDEAQEGKDAYLDKRRPEFERFPAGRETGRRAATPP